MIYAASSVWLTLCVLASWAIYHLWSGMLNPRVVNTALLPGTLIAQLGRILGLLVTGATVNDTALMSDDGKGEPAAQTDYKPRIPFIGPIVVALLPMLALGAAIFAIVVRFGMPVVKQLPLDGVETTLPTALPQFWDQLRALITLAENTLSAVRSAEGDVWITALFGYLMICFTVRMAPVHGNARGHVGAIIALGIFGALAGSLSPRPPELIAEAWPILTLTIGCLLLLLMISLVTRGVVSTVQLIARVS